MVGSPDNKIIFEDANIADHMRQTAPDIEAFLIVQKMRNAQEFGIMAPKKGVNCFPASASIQFIKYVKKNAQNFSLLLFRLLKDYLEQSKSEINYIEAKRAQDKLKELSDHELRRQCRYME